MDEDVLELTREHTHNPLQRSKRAFYWLVFFLAFNAVILTALGLMVFWVSSKTSPKTSLVTFTVAFTLAIWQIQAARSLYKFNRVNSTAGFADFSSKMGAVFLLQTLTLLVQVMVVLYSNFG